MSTDQRRQLETIPTQLYWRVESRPVLLSSKRCNSSMFNFPPTAWLNNRCCQQISCYVEEDDGKVGENRKNDTWCDNKGGGFFVLLYTNTHGEVAHSICWESVAVITRSISKNIFVGWCMAVKEDIGVSGSKGRSIPPLFPRHNKKKERNSIETIEKLLYFYDNRFGLCKESWRRFFA